MTNKAPFFERNLRALSGRNRETAALLSKAGTKPGLYRFAESRSGETVPALPGPGGSSRPLHSMMDPGKEAKRLIENAGNGGFLILPGLGGGYYARAALEKESVEMTLVIEYDRDGLAELLSGKDYTKIFEDPRFRLVVDMDGDALKQYILDLYKPVLHGGIQVIPLRPRTALLPELFGRAGEAITAALKSVSADYSVQAHFGKRWFSNIVKNLAEAEQFEGVLPPVRRAALSAAGPSLSVQLPRIKERRREFFLIATDTSLPCLLRGGITPDAVISIDCQHISYYHFMERVPEEIPLFLDLASPPLLSSCAGKTRFFSGGHPLTRYISRSWKAIPEIDTSGGNVTYAGISLAGQLGADEIELYGADFSYPEGVSYARGTYIYDFFEKRQSRFSPLEAQASSFLYRTPLVKTSGPDASWYYETGALAFYRERLEEKSAAMEAAIIPVPGRGAPLKLKEGVKGKRSARRFLSGKAIMSADAFLSRYKSEIEKLPVPEKNTASFLSALNGEERAVLATLLPAAAALKQERGEENFKELLAATKEYCLNIIDAGIPKTKSPPENSRVREIRE